LARPITQETATFLARESILKSSRYFINISIGEAIAAVGSFQISARFVGQQVRRIVDRLNRRC